jgi:hypothetical protein
MEISIYNSIEYVLIIHKPQFTMLDAIFTQRNTWKKPYVNILRIVILKKRKKAKILFTITRTRWGPYNLKKGR